VVCGGILITPYGNDIKEKRREKEDR